MWLMGKVLVCLAFLPAPSLNKRRKPGFVKVADALSLDLGFLGRSFYVTEFSSPPQIFFFVFLTSHKWGSKPIGLFLLCCLSICSSSSLFQFLVFWGFFCLVFLVFLVFFGHCYYCFSPSVGAKLFP